MSTCTPLLIKEVIVIFNSLQRGKSCGVVNPSAKFQYQMWSLPLLSVNKTSPFFCRSGNILHIDRERRYTDECQSVVVYSRHTTLWPYPRESEKGRFISRRVVECTKHLITHCDIADGRHHVRVLCADLQLRKQRKDKHYYSHNRCDIAELLLYM